MKTWQKLKKHPELWDRYFIREKVLTAIRRFFLDRGFHEIETPLLIARPPAESYIDVFATTLYDRHRNPTPAYLSTSPEVPLKKLLVAGVGNCFSLPKSFRNMEMQGNLHNPEFTILEWYRVGADYTDIMKDCEELLLFINAYLQRTPTRSGAGQGGVKTAGTTPSELVYQGKHVDLSASWERLTMVEAFKKYAKVDLNAFFDIQVARRVVKEKGYTVEEKNTWEELYNQIFLNEVEPCLGRGKPTILSEFPGSMAALARKKPDDPRYAERFEFYIEGLELGDACSELTDPVEQEERFKEELAEVKRLGKTEYEYDHDFIDALKEGLPECSGIAVGVDRLIMLFADTKDIADTLFFPVNELFHSAK